MGAAVVIQRWAALLHYDPALRARVYAGPVEGLAEADRAALTAVDRRAWGVDAQLRGRALDAVVEELPATTALVARARGLAALDTFFSAPEFHAVVLERGHLAFAFAAWARPDAGPVAALEAAVARVRRSHPPADPTRLTRGPNAGVALPEGTLARFQSLRAWLGPRPLATLTARRPPPPLPPLGAGVERLLIERHGGEVAVAPGAEALLDLLDALPLTPADAVARARELGCEDDAEAADLLAELTREGLVVAPAG